jgi:hypothetical protein
MDDEIPEFFFSKPFFSFLKHFTLLTAEQNCLKYQTNQRINILRLSKKAKISLQVQIRNQNNTTTYRKKCKQSSFLLIPGSSEAK